MVAKDISSRLPILTIKKKKINYGKNNKKQE